MIAYRSSQHGKRIRKKIVLRKKIKSGSGGQTKNSKKETQSYMPTEDLFYFIATYEQNNLTN
jgi:hypothetical protein